MNIEDPYRDQAERLRKRIDRNPESEKTVKGKSELPPRSRLHQEKRKKNKWKIKYPMISLLALFFVLLPITIYSIVQSLEKDKLNDTEKVSKTESGFETVDFDNDEDESKGTIIEVRDPEKEEHKDEKLDENESDIPVNTTVPNTEVADKTEKNDSVSNENTNKNEKEEPKDDENKEEETEKEKEDIVYHTVKPNETIYRIAMNYYQSQAGIEIIKKANKLKNNEIQVGQVLAIPKKK